jgi:hypothetical protein
MPPMEDESDITTLRALFGTLVRQASENAQSASSFVRKVVGSHQSADVTSEPPSMQVNPATLERYTRDFFSLLVPIVRDAGRFRESRLTLLQIVDVPGRKRYADCSKSAYSCSRTRSTSSPQHHSSSPSRSTASTQRTGSIRRHIRCRPSSQPSSTLPACSSSNTVSQLRMRL